MKKKICFFSFLLPFLSMMAIFIGNGIYPFGDQSFMHSDMYHQYVPFLEEFVRKVRDGEPLYYSWRIGMGSNYLSLYGYYSASPFNWLMLLCPKIFNRIYELHGRFQNRSVRLYLFLAFDRKIPHKRPFCPVLFHILCDVRLRCRI